MCVGQAYFPFRILKITQMDLVTLNTDYPDKDYRVAFHGFPDTVREICASYEHPDIFEIGGGRRPLFMPDQWPANLSSYTINDIDQQELDLAPAQNKTQCFDICDTVAHLNNSYDIIFSRFVGEHVRDGEKMHRNILSMLRPGGTAFHFVPTLYALPFFVNWLVPETFARQVLFVINPSRGKMKVKFPAHYSWCRGSNRTLQKRLEELGYSRVRIDRFYGHHYFQKIPILKGFERTTRHLLRKTDLTTFGSYAYITVTK